MLCAELFPDHMKESHNLNIYVNLNIKFHFIDTRKL